MKIAVSSEGPGLDSMVAVSYTHLIPGVGVKSVDIWRNISGEGDHLD